MAPGQNSQLEKVIDEALKSGDVQALDVFLQRDIYEGTPIKCSQQFLSKLDKLVSRSLDQNNTKSASLGLTILYKCGKNLELPGCCQGLSGIIAQGLLKKMVHWFEKCRQLWIQCGPQWDEILFNLSEDFFDALMVVHDAGKEGAYKITESFLYPVGHLVVDPRIYILIQKEAIRKFNLMLDKIPMELKKKRKLLTSQDASDIMTKLAGQILEAGDYDLQIALMEALCRMATPDQRKELADRWFSMEHVASAFVMICDSEFETDCRKFLNLVNGMQGDKRRVYSYPCLEVYLDKYELLMPADEKLEEYWIDFNLGSHSLSFYFSLTDEEAREGQWETICINENEVQSYTVTEEGRRQVLQLKLSEVVVVGAVEGSSLTIHFSSSLDVMQAARSIYGHSKNKGFVGKTGTSVVKTTVKIIMEENSCQVVPESQVSLGDSEKNTAPYCLSVSSTPVQMVTPAKMRISESTTFNSSVRGDSSLSAVMLSNTPARVKGKPSLEMVRSCDKQGEFYLGELRTTTKTCSLGTTPNSATAGGMLEQNIPVEKAADIVLAGQGEEQALEQTFVPDTQPRTGRNISSNWSKLSVSEMLTMPTQKINSLPRPEPHPCSAQQQEHLSSTQRLSVPVLGPISEKQLNTKLTQRLRQVLRERNQDPAPQEPAAPQRKMLGITEDSKGRNSVDWCASTVCTPKEQPAQSNGPAESKGLMSMEADAALIKGPAKVSTTKSLQQQKPPNIKGETNLSSKIKRDAEVAGSMVKLISSRYEINSQSTAKYTAGKIPPSWSPPIVNRPTFNMSWLSTAKRDVSGAVSLMKSYSKTTTSSMRQRKDIFAFNIDVPLSIEGKDKTFTNTSATSSSGIHDSVPLNKTKEGQPVAKEKRHVKKHLFSDTDTDHAMTDVSWLRESSRKPKPKVTKYSRQAPIKPKAVSPHTSYESPDLPPPSQKPVNCNTKRSKKKPGVKERVEQPKKTVKPVAAGRRPQRAAAASTKSYREPDTDDSQSESETPLVPKHSSTNHLENAEKSHEAARVINKKTASKQPTKSDVKLESSNHSSQSESEEPPTSKVEECFVGQQGKNEKTRSGVPEVKKRKNTSSEQSTDAYKRLDRNNQSDLKKPSGLKRQRPEKVVPETSRLNKKNDVPAQEHTATLKDSWAARQTSFCPSPPSIERMRSAERSAPTSGLTCSPLLTPRGSPLPPSPDPLCQDTPSPILLLPKPRSTVSSTGNFKTPSFYRAEKKCSSSKTLSIRSVPSLPSLTPIGQTPALGAPTGPSAAEISPVQHGLPSPSQSPLSPSTVPLLTSTLLELHKPSMPSAPQSPFPEDTADHGHNYGFSKVSSVSLSQSTKSSVLTTRVEDSPTAAMAVFHKKEKTPPSDQGLKPAELHMSGPSRKRQNFSSSNSEEDEKEERKKSKLREQRSPRMKPRKLFKSCMTCPVTEVSAEGEVSRVISSSHAVSSSHWEAEVGDGDVDMDEDLELPKIAVNPRDLCQQFSSELKKKFQNRYKMMEVYNKQSLKTVQQHVTSLNMQVSKYRTQRLEQVQEVLLEEIHKLEQDDSVLKNMEKDLTLYWKKQTMAFRSYQELETRRNETLKKALQTNACQSLEYEERIFTSQMCLIRKDMKSVQDRLLSQMQEGELESVKRGLHALFFP
ncbi:synaptonemal complex protein 2 isoform X5 [Micropterus salmoides]|uniref:synaptonemal complex protein 2 isoform X5 n=1 Tax=Micropterus salmoides TaxID=27706 RepID=UPI0018EDBE41|nr:synaptonemal complex protein 2 isoform X5 [Micropterus salmoides]